MPITEELVATTGLQHAINEAIASPSYSSISQFQRCPQQWHYSRVLHLQQPDDAAPQPALELGSWWHALRAADSIDRGRALDSLRSAPELLVLPRLDPLRTMNSEPLVPQVLAAVDRFWASLSLDDATVWVEALKESLPDRLRDMWDRFLVRFAEDREHEQPLAVEMGWGRDLPARSEIASSRDVRFRGYVDEVLLDTRRGLVIIRDHKTGKAFPQTVRDVDSAFATSQLSLYAWGIAPVVGSWGVGQIAAVEFDRARTAKPTPPKLTAKGALSKTVTQFDLETYLAWVAERRRVNAGPHMTPDPAVVADLSTPAKRNLWFARERIPLNMQVVRTHMRDMQRTTMLQASETYLAIVLGEPRLRRTSGASCTYCDFRALCSAETRGGVIHDLTPEVLRDFGLEQRPSKR